MAPPHPPPPPVMAQFLCLTVPFVSIRRGVWIWNAEFRHLLYWTADGPDAAPPACTLLLSPPPPPPSVTCCSVIENVWVIRRSLVRAYVWSQCLLVQRPVCLCVCDGEVETWHRLTICLTEWRNLIGHRESLKKWFYIYFFISKPSNSGIYILFAVSLHKHRSHNSFKVKFRYFWNIFFPWAPDNIASFALNFVGQQLSLGGHGERTSDTVSVNLPAAPCSPALTAIWCVYLKISLKFSATESH